MSSDSLDKHKSIDPEPGWDGEVSLSVVGAGVRCRDRRVGLWIDPRYQPGLPPGADAPAPCPQARWRHEHLPDQRAWTAALVMMALADVLTRLVTVYLRGRSVAAKATPVVAASVP